MRRPVPVIFKRRTLTAIPPRKTVSPILVRARIRRRPHVHVPAKPRIGRSLLNTVYAAITGYFDPPNPSTGDLTAPTLTTFENNPDDSITSTPSAASFDPTNPSG